MTRLAHSKSNYSCLYRLIDMTPKMQSVAKELYNSVLSKTADTIVPKVPPPIYVVAATACLPYSDDGPMGWGLQLSCVKTEQEAVQTAVKFMKRYIGEIVYLSDDNEAGVSDDFYRVRTQELCAEGLKLINFSQLKSWFDDFGGTIGEYVYAEREDCSHRTGSNVGSSLSLHIKDAATDSYLLKYD